MRNIVQVHMDVIKEEAIKLQIPPQDLQKMLSSAVDDLLTELVCQSIFLLRLATLINAALFSVNHNVSFH